MFSLDFLAKIAKMIENAQKKTEDKCRALLDQSESRILLTLQKILQEVIVLQSIPAMQNAAIAAAQTVIPQNPFEDVEAFVTFNKDLADADKFKALVSLPLGCTYRRSF